MKRWFLLPKNITDLNVPVFKMQNKIQTGKFYIRNMLIFQNVLRIFNHHHEHPSFEMYMQKQKDKKQKSKKKKCQHLLNNTNYQT